ncbi:MAG: hypothetical protein JO112_04790, partial [Planctomycetes bacterium]|nr:hypothetical protein [Planctomycetota bacterium]
KEQQTQAETWEADTRRLEETLVRVDEATHEQEALLANARRQIAAAETTQNHEWALSGDLEADLAATRARMTGLNARVSALAEAASQAAGELHGAEAQSQDHHQKVQALEEDLAKVVQRLAELTQQKQEDNDAELDTTRQSARLQNEANQCKSRVDLLRRERDRLRFKSAQAAEHLASLDVELEELTRHEESLQTRLATARQGLADRRQERDRLRQLRDDTTRIVAQLREQRSGLASRMEVLEGLERSHEGLGTGVREVFALMEQPDPGPWATVLGIIADFLTVRREYAPLIDLALGERAQRFLVRDASLLAEAFRQRGQPFSGRVSFLPLTPAAATRSSANGSASESRANRLIEVSPQGRVRMPVSPAGAPVHPGVVAAAEQLVACEAQELADLPAQLLGRTLVVRDLATARAIAAHTSGYRFITLQGELLDPDGTLTVGTHHAETGLLSRKSELRELREQAADLDRRIGETERDLADLRDRLTRLDAHTATLQEEIHGLAEQATEVRSRLGQHRQRREGLHEEVTLSRREISEVEREMAELEEAWQLARAQAEEAERQVQVLRARIDSAGREIREREQERDQRQQEVTSAKVALAKVEERLAALRARHRQIEGDLEQRRQERRQGQQHLAGARTRLEESQRTLLQASSALAQWYLEKEAAERQVAELGRERDLFRQERHLLAERAQTARHDWRSRQEQAHGRELAVNDLRHRRDTLVARLREDYQVDLQELYRKRKEEVPAPGTEGSSCPPLNAAQANEEIEELRRKL